MSEGGLSVSWREKPERRTSRRCAVCRCDGLTRIMRSPAPSARRWSRARVLTPRTCYPNKALRVTWCTAFGTGTAPGDGTVNYCRWAAPYQCSEMSMV